MKLFYNKSDVSDVSLSLTDTGRSFSLFRLFFQLQLKKQLRDAAEDIHRPTELNCLLTFIYTSTMVQLQLVTSGFKR